MSERVPRKRAAFESPVRLARPLAYDPHMPRPAATVAGGLLVLLRVLAGVFWLLSITLEWRHIVHDASLVIDGVPLSEEERALGLGFVWAVGGAVLLFDTVMAIFVLRGGNRSRVTVLVFSVLSISFAFSTWWVQGQDIRISGTLLNLGLDILVLLALSSRKAAAYARRNERR